MVKYENSKIYKIVDNTNGNIYIGSTVKKLSERLGQHRAHYKMFLDGKMNYIKSYEIISNGDYDIILLEECQNITNKEQLHARERFYIDNLECVNKCRPGIKNELGKKEYDKNFYEANKEQIKQQMKLNNYQKITCTHCNIELMKAHKWQHQRTKKHQQNLQNQKNTE